jgi:hypothetical protein
MKPASGLASGDVWGVIITRPDALKGDVRAYYEIAATLIPLLVFGGVVTERVIPPKGRWKAIHFGAAMWAIPASGFYAVLAEVLAITAVVTGEADALTRYVVSGAIVGGMLAVVCSIWLPWLAGVREESGQPLSRQTKWAIGLSVTAVGLIALLGLASAVDVAATTERTREFEAVLQKNLDEQEAVRGRLIREMARSEGFQQEVVQAEEHHEARRFLALLAAQRRVGRLIDLDIREENRLLLESANLYRELVGLPTLKHLIYKHPPRGGGQPQKRPRGDGAGSGP